jgi:hypothetical protein
MQCIQGLDACQLDFLKYSLDVCRSEYDYLHAPLDDLSMQAPLHSTKQIHQVRFRQDQSFQPSPHLQVPNIQPTMPHNMHMIPGGPPPIPGRPYSIPMGDPRANPMMFGNLMNTYLSPLTSLTLPSSTDTAYAANHPSASPSPHTLR